MNRTIRESDYSGGVSQSITNEDSQRRKNGISIRRVDRYAIGIPAVPVKLNEEDNRKYAYRIMSSTG